MNAIIIAIGHELITGQSVDTNSAYLARELGRRGIETIEHLTVDDDQQVIASAISSSAKRCDIVLATGGLGPTADDLTRQGLSEAMKSELVLDEQCLEKIKEFFCNRGRKMAGENEIQAMIPRGAQALQNSLGTAPGIAARVNGADVFVMPGVPSEMESMFHKLVAPLLPKKSGIILHKLVHIYGKGESDIAAEVSDIMHRKGAVTVGITVTAGKISLRITSRADDEKTAQAQADKTADEIRRRLGELVFGQDEETMASVVGNLLVKNSQTLATAESCTGGLIGELITSVAGSSEYYLGGIISYSNQLKIDQLGVPKKLLIEHGAVSQQVAQAMVKGCKERLGSDWAIAITGIAGPIGGTEEKPVGLVYIALAGPETVKVHRHIFPGTRDIVRLRSAMSALNYLRLELLKFSV